MKRLSCLITGVFLLTTIFAQNQNWLAADYSNDVTFIGESVGVVTVRTSGIADKKKDAPDMAVRSAFYTYFFVGIQGLNNGKPLLDPNDIMKYRDYMERFFDQGRYHNFVRDYETEDSEKLSYNKKYKATVRLIFLNEVLLRDLEQNKIITKAVDRISMEETQEQINMPTIMVVPYKAEGESYDEILSNDFDKRIAVAKVQEGFTNKGVTIVDFQAKLAAAKRSMLFETNNSDSFDKQLIRNSGSDVYVTVDINKDVAANGSRVSLSLRAYETSTGNILASKQATSNRFNTNATDQLVLYTISDILDPFLKDISTSFAKKISGGNSIVLNVSIDETSTLDMESEVGTSGYYLSDLLRLWVKKNAVGGKYHVQGTVADAIIFDQIQIPNKDESGTPLDANDFAFKLWEYLQQEGISCKRRVDGNTIYITITA
ncbi:MAG: DUF6175 family protein [Culturomica sp.]|jgi:hypothetical protein|nr:DUF6175 family protein [Culturomica sp.]